MANYLDANPSEVPTLNHHRADPRGLVPVVRNGELAGMVNRRAVDRVIIPSPLSAEDYVVGLEVLGFRFELDHRADGRTGVFTHNPTQETPPGWHAMSIAIMAAFDSRERHGELAAFLLDRDGEAS